MTALANSGGVVRWATGPLATDEEADAYAAARDWTNWGAASEAKRKGAILEAGSYVRFNWIAPRAFSDEADQAATEAVIEAARLALTQPLMGGNAAAEPQLIRKKTGPLEKEWTVPTQGAAEAASRRRLGLVDAMLRASGAVRLSNGVNIALAKS